MKPQQAHQPQQQQELHQQHQLKHPQQPHQPVKHSNKHKGSQADPCPRACQLVPTNVPGPSNTQAVLHPRKDVFVLKVSKVGAKGERRSKMELELVTPKGPQRKVPQRIDTKGTQCLPPPCTGCCFKSIC